MKILICDTLPEHVVDQIKAIKHLELLEKDSNNIEKQIVEQANIVIVSPSTLIATLRTIASIWRQENQNRNALEIAKHGGALFDKDDVLVGIASFVLFDECSIQQILHWLASCSKAWKALLSKNRRPTQ